MAKKRRKSFVMDYVRSGKVLIPLCLMSHEDFMSFMEAYAEGKIELITRFFT
ncbi:hypothetical protein [Paenibacillus koleovorans]|uniref:hypothetical protein n=1 Tax=Paenibacillus koleovorans TaxID=121608 RepID=UPI0013E300BA|nr:hypothetical protein [Paenibacillus koleovorans]